MFEVIICTVSTGRVQHQLFDTYEKARRCADRWAAKTRRYRVSINQRDLPVVRSIESASGDGQGDTAAA